MAINEVSSLFFCYRIFIEVVEEKKRIRMLQLTARPSQLHLFLLWFSQKCQVSPDPGRPQPPFQ